MEMSEVLLKYMYTYHARCRSRSRQNEVKVHDNTSVGEDDVVQLARCAFICEGGCLVALSYNL